MTNLPTTLIDEDQEIDTMVDASPTGSIRRRGADI